MKISWKSISAGVVSHTPWIVAAVAIASYVAPGGFTWVRGMVTKGLLGFIMLTMGMTLTTADLRIVLARPWEIALGALGQFTLMPLIAFTIALQLPDGARGVAVGLILVGCCPGGVSSNLMSYLCKGDVAFSVGMTTVSTLLAPFVTPLLTAYLVSRLGVSDEVSVDRLKMFKDLLYVTLLPVATGFMLNRLLGARESFSRAKAHLPALAVAALACIVGGVMSGYRLRPAEAATVSLGAVCCAVFLHNALGYATGYALGCCARFSEPKRRTVSIEIGMQNAGLATELSKSLSANVKADASVAAAVSCVWHSISGALLAGLFNLFDRLRRRVGVNRLAVVFGLSLVLAGGLQAAVSLTAGTDASRPRKPLGLSGITWAGGERYYAVSDDGHGEEGGIYSLSIALTPDGRGIRSLTIDEPAQRVKLLAAYDLEGCAYDRAHDTLWAVDEMRGSIREYDLTTGKVRSEVTMPDRLRNSTRSNLGLESLTLSEDGLTLWTANEEALTCDGATASPTNGTLVRLVRFTRRNAAAPFVCSGMFAYETERWSHSASFGPACRHGVADLAALPDGRLLVLERDLSTPVAGNRLLARFTTTICLVDPRQGKDCSANASFAKERPVPLAKEKLLELKRLWANNEGLCLGPRLENGDRVLMLVSDAGDGLTACKVTPLLLRGLDGAPEARSR